MKAFCSFVFFLVGISANSQTILPVDELRSLWRMIDSLSYPESDQFDESYNINYVADSGWVALSKEKFIKETTSKTPDQYQTYFKLWDIDPSTVTIKSKNGSYGLIFFTGNNKPLIHNMVYVNGEERMVSEGDRKAMGYWKEESDKAILQNIKTELIRLINLTWNGDPPQYHTDTALMAPLIIDGEEVVFSGGKMDEREVFLSADQMPLYGNGNTMEESDIEIENYFNKRLKADDIQHSGKVYASFYVEKDGSISNIKLLKTCGNKLDDLISIYLRSMRNWKPGMRDGEPVVVVKHVVMMN